MQSQVEYENIVIHLYIVRQEIHNKWIALILLTDYHILASGHLEKILYKDSCWLDTISVK